MKNEEAKSQITDTTSARKFVDAWHRKHFPTDRTFSRYIMADPARSNPLAGDFAFQLAKALESLVTSQAGLSDLETYPSPHGTLVRLADVKCRVSAFAAQPASSAKVAKKEFDTDEMFDIASGRAEETSEDGSRKFTGDGLIDFSRDLLERFAAPATAQPELVRADILRTCVQDMARLLAAGEWADLMCADDDAQALETEITKLVGRVAPATAQVASAEQIAQIYEETTGYALSDEDTASVRAFAYGLLRRFSAPATAQVAQAEHLREFVQGFVNWSINESENEGEDCCRACSGLAVWNEGKNDWDVNHRAECPVPRAEYWIAAPTVSAAAPAEQTQAALDVLAERRRQVEQEGWTPEHDDQYRPGTMARAAACYAAINSRPVPSMWPWAPEWWKPRDDRSNYVRAGALILAEIERLDHATHQPTPTGAEK